MKSGSLILLWVLPLVCPAQIPSESRAIFTRKEGLSNNSVTALIKDTRGFLWIGTSEGLNRYDGDHFTSFFSDPGNPSTLSGNDIFDLLLYQPDRLLIATDNGLSVLNTVTGRFQNEMIGLPALKKGSGIYIRSLFKDDQGQVYVNHSGEIDVFTNDLRFLYRLTDTDWGRSLKGIIVYYEHWLQDSKGLIWLPSDNFGICIMDIRRHKVYNYRNNPFHYSFLHNTPVRSFYYDEARQQVFLSAFGLGLEKHDMATGKVDVQYFNLTHTGESRTINALTCKNGRLICLGGQYIYSLDPATMRYEQLYQDLSTPATNSFINCLTVLNDQENIWIGTETKGLLQIPCRVSFIRQVVLPYTVKDYTYFCTDIIRRPDGLLYFAYGVEGLVEMDRQTNRTIQYRINDENKLPVIVHRICSVAGNEILLGTSAGFFLFNTTTKTSKRPGWLPPFTRKLSIISLFRDSRDNIWTSFNNPVGLGYYESKSGKFNYYPGYLVNGKKVSDPNYFITRITEDEKGDLWMISFQAMGKILHYEFSSASWSTWPKTAQAAKIFAGKELNSISIIGNTLWVGNTYGLGLIKYDLDTDSFRRFGRKDGLLSDNIFSINRDKKNNLFLSTLAGINYFNTATNEIRTLIAGDGSIDWGFAHNQYYDTTDNQLIYGLNDRIVIAKSQLWAAPATDTLFTYIDAVKINNEPYPLDGRPIELTHSRRNISINFTSINYNKNTTVSYAYKMNGVDKDFNIGQQVTTTNYSNLSPGHYTFLVKAKGQSGVWGPVNDSISFTILPIFWQTAWFWALAAISVTLIVTGLVRRRISYIKKNAAMKQKLADTEMMALRAQMNPHFIFNCLNAIDALMQTNQADKATTYLAMFARLIRSLLENSKNNVIPLHKDVETLQLYLDLELFRTSNKFSYDLQVDPELINGDYKVPPLIIQPFVENAIQHGLLNKQDGPRRLSIIASLHDGFIQYVICDNGVGREKAGEIKNRNKPEHKSYGILITAERLQLYNQNDQEKDIIITDLSEDGQAYGTRIEVRIRTD